MFSSQPPKQPDQEKQDSNDQDSLTSLVESLAKFKLANTQADFLFLDSDYLKELQQKSGYFSPDTILIDADDVPILQDLTEQHRQIKNKAQI